MINQERCFQVQMAQVANVQAEVSVAGAVQLQTYVDAMLSDNVNPGVVANTLGSAGHTPE